MADGNSSQKFQAALAITTDSGAAATVDGVPVWASSDETVISVANIAPDGMSADIMCVAPGTARVSVTADADMGAGSQVITGVTEDINVVVDPATLASVMTLTLAAPVPKA